MCTKSTEHASGTLFTCCVVYTTGRSLYVAIYRTYFNIIFYYVDKMNEETREKVAQAEKSGSFRAKSSSELKKRQAILAAKQSIIGNMLDKA